MTWGQDQGEKRAMLWGLIDKAVEHESARTKVAARFLPLVGPLGDNVSTVEADRIVLDDKDPDGKFELRETLTVDPSETTPIGEIFVQFALTNEQVEKEVTSYTAVTLATRVTNYLYKAEDLLIFGGESGMAKDPLSGRVKFGPGSKFGEGLGLLPEI